MTDITCEQCGEPVCEDCCVQMTIHNQIDYPLCFGCEGENDAERWADATRKAEKEKLESEKKKQRAEARRKAYWKPEAVEKRRLKKKKNAELKRKQMQEAMRTIAEAFKGMF